MKHKFVIGLLISSVILIVLMFAITGGITAQGSAPESGSAPQAPVGSAFTYQGQLKNGGNAVTGSCQMAFRLYDTLVSGSLIGSPITTTVPVTNGLFTVGLNFGSNAFNGNGRWLDINVNCGSGFTPLTPRQAVTAAPYSLFALSTGALQSYPVTTTAPSSGQVLKWNGSTWVPGVDAGGTAYSAGFGLTLIGNQFKVVTSTIQQRVSSSCSVGNAIRVVNQDGSVSCEPINSNFWGLTGNSGTGGTGFVGTTDNTALTIGVNGQGVLRLYPQSQSPNIIGGYSGNYVSSTLYGQTIAGGGSFFYENRVLNTFGTVGGGRSNHADSYGSTIAGGIDNQATNDYTTVAGGLHNYATGSSSGIGGGFYNVASGYAAYVGGGFYNVASGYVAYVGGGDLNIASTQNATIGGGYSNTITGGQLIANNTIGGGVFNFNSGFAATIAGGHGNQATGEWSTMGGGGFNTASGRSTTVSGGEYNIASGAGSTIGGGGWNGSGSSGNIAYGAASTIDGGYGNYISPDAGYGVIGGGQQNSITATPSSNLNIATIGGGYNNKVALGGGTVGGGNSNTASNFDATVGGGNGNVASGSASTVPGGSSNLAQGSTSFAAGYRAKAYNNGCFTWADSNNFDYGCGADNAFTARATGGVYFVTAINGSGAGIAGVQLAAGGNAWAALSDRNSKANFAPVDARSVVEKLAQIPISTWNYKTQDAAIRHIGPMAQDFAAAFNVGEDDTHITTIDADGVALTAIQGLYQMVQDKDRRIAQLETDVAQLKQGAAPAQPVNVSNVISLIALGGVVLIGLKQRRGQTRSYRTHTRP